MKFSPRNDYVVFKRVKRGRTITGIAVSDQAVEGVDHVIVVIGPKVQELKEGDKVLILGTLGQDYGQIPGSKDLFVTKESNVVLIYEEE